MQTSCPKCLALISGNVTKCPVCGVSEATLRAEAAAARSQQAPSSRPSLFRWKRESVELLKFLLIALAVSLAIRWLIGTLFLDKGFLEGWW
jgi:hypothetical protein